MRRNLRCQRRTHTDVSTQLPYCGKRASENRVTTMSSHSIQVLAAVVLLTCSILLLTDVCVDAFVASSIAVLPSVCHRGLTRAATTMSANGGSSSGRSKSSQGPRTQEEDQKRTSREFAGEKKRRTIYENHRSSANMTRTDWRCQLSNFCAFVLYHMAGRR